MASGHEIMFDMLGQRTYDSSNRVFEVMRGGPALPREDTSFDETPGGSDLAPMIGTVDYPFDAMTGELLPVDPVEGQEAQIGPGVMPAEVVAYNGIGETFQTGSSSS